MNHFFFQPVQFCNLNHEKNSEFTKILILSTSTAMVVFDFIIRSSRKDGTSKLESFLMDTTFNKKVQS